MLDKALSKEGFCFPTNVILESVRYGGVIATGCHGAGWNNAPLSDWVERIKMINYEGIAITFQIIKKM
jgi:FAD/FMN-containing dehydrogenase